MFSLTLFDYFASSYAILPNKITDKGRRDQVDRRKVVRE